MSSCCCDNHSDDASLKIWGEGVKGNSAPGYPSISRCCGVHETPKPKSRLMIAWTIVKLKVTRRFLSVFLRIHIWYELRSKKK